MRNREWGIKRLRESEIALAIIHWGINIHRQDVPLILAHQVTCKGVTKLTKI